MERFNDKLLKTFQETLRPANIAIWLFVLVTLFVVIFTKYNIGSDEIYHFEYIKFFADHSLSPFVATQDDHFWLKDITREVSYLYHYLFSFLYRGLSTLGVGEYLYVFLRLPNIAFTALSLYLFRTLGTEMKLSRLSVNLSTIFFSTIPMFIIIAGTINYDNLLILQAILTFILVMKIHNDPLKAQNYLYILVLAAFSAITKFVYLPIAAAVGVYIIYRLIKHRSELFENTKTYFSSNKIQAILLSILLVLGVGLALERYAVNLVEYNTISVKCDQLHSIEECRQNGVFNRDYQIAQNPNQDIWRMNIVRYLAEWFINMNNRIYGMTIHIGFTTHPFFTFGSLVFYAIMTAGMAIKMRGKELKRYWPILLAFGFYTVALIATHYSTYLKTSYETLSVQGRYIFPVIIPILMLGMHYTWEILRNRKLKLGYIYAVVVFSALSGLPYMFYGLNLEEWLIF